MLSKDERSRLLDGAGSYLVQEGRSMSFDLKRLVQSFSPEHRQCQCGVALLMRSEKRREEVKHRLRIAVNLYEFVKLYGTLEFGCSRHNDGEILA